MKLSKRLISFILCFALIVTMMPLSVFAAEDEAVTIDNGYIEASVSTRNGGFIIKTIEGNLLKKSDNNKKLLYHNGHYDTSFVSFRVGSGKDAKDYLFGGKYPGSSDVSVAKTNDGEIAAVWSVDGITFTQLITMAEDNSNEHGMVSIGLAATNGSGKAVPVQARILLDTCLGDKDYAWYQFTGIDYTTTLRSEQFITDQTTTRVFYAVDDVADPSVAAYVVSEPEKVAIGHWNNLAASLFDFAPDENLGFTSNINDYLTADSACAMYYDLGTVASGGTGTVVSYYGIYSNSKVKLDNRIAINTTSPMRLNLNKDKTAFIRESDVGVADFAVTISAENYKSDSSMKLKDVKMAVTSTSGLRPLSDSGQPINNLDYLDANPLTIPYTEIDENETVTKTVYFQAKPVENASYERITIGMYLNEITGENLLGEKVIYILLPGNDGTIPKVSFPKMTPDTVYNSGTRHLYAAVTNDVLLDDSLSAGNCSFRAYSADGKKSWAIPTDNITINEGIADIVLSDEEKLPVGNYYLQLEWTDAAVAKEFVDPAHQKTTAESLRFGVSDNPKYKNDTYGVLAAVKYGKGTNTEPYYYRLERFPDETAFKAFQSNKDHAWKEILLILRGAFSADNRYLIKEGGKTTGGLYYSAVSKKVVDPKTRKEKIDNPVTINNCLDFEGGTISIYYENYEQGIDKALNSAILVDIDGELYTCGARTSVWTGKAAITKLAQGDDFSLTHYDPHGNRKSTQSKPVTLIWPSVFSVAQTLAGLAVKLAYGQFGVMDVEGLEESRVIAFAAGLSLSFLQVGDDDDTDYGTASYFGRMQELWKDWRGASIYQYAYHGNRYEKLTDISMNDKDNSPDTKQGVQASVMINDILFGCGKGLVGLNFDVDVTIRNVIDDFAAIQGHLKVNTIHNWGVSLAGSCKMTDKLKMEAKLSFKSYKGAPIPDELYFYIGGLKPGINVDGCGVLWITGAGGGFSNLYDTIFCSSGLPPLKLILTLSFNIVQVLEGTGRLEMQLSGFNITATDLKAFDAITIIKKTQVGFQWYPDLKIHGAIYVSMFEKCIEGNGYIILVGKDYSDWFFEMFLRAAVKIPSSVPVVGGVKIASADLGINTERIWGALEVLSIYTSIVYYWGDDGVKFGTSGDKAHPTYPSLLFNGYDEEMGGYPVAYDEENDRILYMSFGNNFGEPESAQPMSDDDLILMGTRGAWSDGDRTTHKFDLGAYDRDSNAQAMIQLNFEAESLEEAKTIAKNFTVTANRDGSGETFPLEFLEEDNADTANANVSFYEGKASFGFTATDAALFDKPWFISTGDTAAEVVLYNVMPLPEITEVSASADAAAGSSIDVAWNGEVLSELDSVSFFLVTDEDPTVDTGYPLSASGHDAGITDSAVISSGNAALTVPAGVPAGEYLIRAVYSKEDQVNGIVHSAAKTTVTNDFTPAKADMTEVTTCGDLKFSVTIAATDDENTSGYSVAVYNEDGTEAAISDLTIEKAEDGPTVFEVGGSYTAPVKTEEDDPESAVSGTEAVGLEGGERYIISVTPYSLVDSDGDGEYDSKVYGSEIRSSAMLLPEAVTPEVTLSAVGKTLVSLKDAVNSGSEEETVFTENNLDFSAVFSEAVSGSWVLDDEDLFTDQFAAGADEAAATDGSFTQSSAADFTVEDLTDGTHTLTIKGKAADGDRFSSSYIFTVDTLAPQLIMSSPLNGSMFADGGKITVSGVTDPDALLTVTVDGKALISGKTVEEAGGAIGADGVFSIELSIPDYNGSLSHAVTVSAADRNGNATEDYEASVYNPAVGDLAEVIIMVGDSIPADGNLDTASTGKAELSLVGVTSDGTRFALDPDMIHWASMAAEGAAEVDGEGLLSYDALTKGFVTGMVEMAQGAYMTAYLTLGAEAEEGFVAVSSTVGGTVSGGGYYEPGQTVTLSAKADEGYEFKGWEISGVAVEDTGAETVTFTMPEGRVEIKAVFKSTRSSDSSGGGSSSGASKPKVGYEPIPEGVDPDLFVPYYTDENGDTVIVPVTQAADGMLAYLIPEGKTVSFKENPVSFIDIDGHWAKENILWTAAHGLFEGVGGGRFNPQGTMTRAMFVTVLYRMAETPKVSGKCRFTDVVPGSWYEDAVIWASQNGIVEGVSDTLFAPNSNVTREQMCALVARYLRHIGAELPLKAKVEFRDADKIASWAKADVEYCQRAGIIEGKSNGIFDPKAGATRAENATVMKRVAEAIVNSYK